MACAPRIVPRGRASSKLVPDAFAFGLPGTIKKSLAGCYNELRSVTSNVSFLQHVHGFFAVHTAGKSHKHLLLSQ